MLILHLSDLHIKDDLSRLSFEHLYESIKHKIADVKNIVFIFSGDIAYSGHENEYVLFDNELKKIIKKIQAEHINIDVYIYLLPGNHDCNFDNNNEIRKIVVNNVKTSGDVKDNSVYELCTSIQDDFFSYMSIVDNGAIKKGKERLCWQKEISIEKYKVIFTFYNTAWLSTIKEDPGSLFYPVEVLSELDESCSNQTFRIGIYHHPDNWLSPKHDEQNHREFRNHVTRLNNLVLTGHEHQDSLKKYNDLSNGYDCYFHESSYYLQGKKYGGFSSIVIKSDCSFEIEEYEFHNEKRYFIMKNQFKNEIKSIESENHNYQLKHEFKYFLNDTEVYVSNSESKKLNLKEIYTFPKLENIETEEICDSEIVLKNKDFEKIALFGTDQSGKTALLKMLFSYWYYLGFTPLYLDASIDIKNTNIRQSLKNVYRKQYDEYKKSFDEYLSLSYDNKIILIDNFHLLKESLERNAILKSVSAFSKKIIVVCDDISALDEVSLGSEENINFQKFSLLPFGHVNRDNMIEKWLSKQDLSHNDLFQLKRKIHIQINDIIKSNLVPSYPLFLLTILQALGASSPNRTEITSYGHCYQTLIYYSIKKNGLKDDEFESVDNFLSHLAYKMYENDSDYLSLGFIEEIYHNYEKDYITTCSFLELIDILMKSKILIKDSMENFSFKYVYIYYYYVAKYISKYEIENKEFITNLCSELEKKENSFIILFITYHSNNQNVIEEIIFSTMKQFDDLDPVTLINSETDFMKDKADEASNTVIENIKPEDYQRKELEEKDNRERQIVKDQDYDVNDNLHKINKALKSLEINGQLLKVRYGTINKTRLKSIIEESFLICYRLIRFLITDLSNEETTILLADQFEEYIKKSNKKISNNPTREELIKAIQALLSNITYYVCHYTLDRTAEFLGSSRLLSLFEEIANKINTPASKLTLTLIELKISNNFDRFKIKKLKEEFKNNSFAYSILRKAAVNFVYMHHLTHDEKSWISSVLNIPIIDQRKIENKRNK